MQTIESQDYNSTDFFLSKERIYFLLELINRRHRQNSTTQVGLMLNPLDEKNQLEIKLNKAEETIRERRISEEKLIHQLSILEEKYALMQQTYNNNNAHKTVVHDQFEKQSHDVLDKNKGQVHLRRENERLKNELEKAKTQISKPAKCKF